MTAVPDPSPRAARFWRGQVAAEYGSAGQTAELLHWCIVLGLSPDTLALAHRIVSDELAHAAGCNDVLRAAGLADDPVELRPEQAVLSAAVGEPVTRRALIVAADTYCLGEGVAVPLFRQMRERARVPSVCAVLDRIGIDERVHAAFGWVLLDELLERTDAADHAWLSAQLDPLCSWRIERYSGPSQPPSPDERAWGLLDPAEAGRIVARTIDASLRPRFAERGLLS